MSINAYYTKFKGIWDKFTDYRNCTCGHQVEDCTMSFLMGLNDTYFVVRGQILLMDPIPPLSKVFSLLLQDERQRKVGAGKKFQVDIATVLAALGNKNNARNFNKNKAGRPQCITVVPWDMWWISVTNYMATHLAISSRIRLVQLLLPTMLLLLTKVQMKECL